MSCDHCDFKKTDRLILFIAHECPSCGCSSLNSLSVRVGRKFMCLECFKSMHSIQDLNEHPLFHKFPVVDEFVHSLDGWALVEWANRLNQLHASL